MAVTVTNSTITALGATGIEATANAATSSTINEAEVFTITPTVPATKYVIRITNGTGHGAVAYSFAAGAFWHSTVAKISSVAAGKTKVIELDDADVKAAAGTIALTLTPATGKRLLTDHAASVEVTELL